MILAATFLLSRDLFLMSNFSFNLLRLHFLCSCNLCMQLFLSFLVFGFFQFFLVLFCFWIERVWPVSWSRIKPLGFLQTCSCYAIICPQIIVFVEWKERKGKRKVTWCGGKWVVWRSLVIGGSSLIGHAGLYSCITLRQSLQDVCILLNILFLNLNIYQRSVYCIFLHLNFLFLYDFWGSENNEVLIVNEAFINKTMIFMRKSNK